MLVYDGFVNAVIIAYYAGRVRGGLKLLGALCCVGVGLVGIVHTGIRCVAWAEQERAERISFEVLLGKLRVMPECKQIGYSYSVYAMTALHFGNALSDRQQGQALNALYPDALTYDVLTGRVLSFLGEDKTDEVAESVAGGRCVLLVGNLMPERLRLPPTLTYRAVRVEGIEAIYRLVHKIPSSGPPLSSDGRQLQNLAVGRPATQSSPFIDPGRAVDGNTDGAFFNNSVTHTQTEANPWWQLDLGASKSVSKIVVWNRTDCCSDRLSNFWVFVSDQPFNPTDKPANLQRRPGTWSSFQEDVPSPDVEIAPDGVRGRYVRIQLAGTNALSLAEVQIYGAAMGR